jgi:pyruvate formate lyase activating enzyme
MEENNPKGVIFNIQRYSIHDGPGIRTTVFFKGCSLRCFWCQNPESQAMLPQIFLYHDRCSLCGKCVEVCPTGAGHLIENYSEIDRDKCIICGKCVQACPNEARKLVGQYYTVDDVIKEIMRDKKFYENSHGGVTLSGGEPLLQPLFVNALLTKCKSDGLHTAIETAGDVSWNEFEPILDLVDLVLFDIKIIEDSRHITGTGISNKCILENARLVSRRKPIIIRMPLIPGFNDSKEDVIALARFVKTELGHLPIELLAYNKMGESKYKLLDREATRREMQENAYLESLREIVKRELETN